MPVRRIENPGEGDPNTVAELAAVGCNLGCWAEACWYGCWSDLSAEALINQGKAINIVVRQIVEAQPAAKSESQS